jgi:hypothetical protein
LAPAPTSPRPRLAPTDDRPTLGDLDLDTTRRHVFLLIIPR